MASAHAKVNGSLPLEITVDFQSKHHAGFRLFTRDSAASPWKFLKQGDSDTTTTSMPLPPGGAIQYEFIFFKEDHPFAAVLILKQNGVTLDGGMVAVTAPGDALLVVDQVELV